MALCQESKEQKKFIRNVNLPYISELGLIVEKNQHMLALIIVHLHKKSRWIKSSLKICPKVCLLLYYRLLWVSSNKIYSLSTFHRFTSYIKISSFLYHFNFFSISEIHIHCEPNYTCHQPPNLRDQEISLDPLEELAINSFGTSMIRSYQ